MPNESVLGKNYTICVRIAAWFLRVFFSSVFLNRGSPWGVSTASLVQSLLVCLSAFAPIGDLPRLGARSHHAIQPKSRTKDTPVMLKNWCQKGEMGKYARIWLVMGGKWPVICWAGNCNVEFPPCKSVVTLVAWGGGGGASTEAGLNTNF